MNRLLSFHRLYTFIFTGKFWAFDFLFLDDLMPELCLLLYLTTLCSFYCISILMLKWFDLFFAMYSFDGYRLVSWGSTRALGADTCLSLP